MYYLKDVDSNLYVKTIENDNGLYYEIQKEATAFNSIQSAVNFVHKFRLETNNIIVVESMTKNEFIAKTKTLLSEIEYSGIGYMEDEDMDGDMQSIEISVCPYCGQEYNHADNCLLSRLLGAYIQGE